MPTTEAEVLSNFLLPPAPLHQVLTLREFTALFPRAYQSNPQVKTLYRDFQYQRAVDIDTVKENIAIEVRRGEKLKRRIALAKSQGDHPAPDQADVQDIIMEAELYGDHVNRPRSEYHTAETLPPAIEKACEDIDAENKVLEAQLKQALQSIQAIVGELSDLRYGKFTKGAVSGESVGQQTLDNLEGLQTVCNDLLEPK